MGELINTFVARRAREKYFAAINRLHVPLTRRLPLDPETETKLEDMKAKVLELFSKIKEAESGR